MIYDLVRESCREAIAVYRAADSVCAEAAGVGSCGRGDLPQAGDLGRDLLQLEEEVFGPGAVGAAAAEAARGRERQAQAPGG